jgi:hypothetical protein
MQKVIFVHTYLLKYHKWYILDILVMYFRGIESIIFLRCNWLKIFIKRFRFRFVCIPKINIITKLFSMPTFNTFIKFKVLSSRVKLSFIFCLCNFCKFKFRGWCLSTTSSPSEPALTTHYLRTQLTQTLVVSMAFISTMTTKIP